MSNYSVKTHKTLKEFFTIKNKNIALATLCLCVLTQNVIVGGANNAILTTIERAFYMSSLESALFLSVYDIANIISSPIIGYFGDRNYKPKIIGVSMLGLSLASCVMIIPKFVFITSPELIDYLSGNNTELQKDQVVCLYNLASNTSLTTTTITLTKQANSLMNKMKFIFYLSNSINGVSSVALYTIVVSYIENIFIKEQVAIRQGIYYAVGSIGVGIGMLITGNFLNINGLSMKKISVNYKQNNVNWIGAWWVIYVLSAGVNCILSLLVFSFSPDLVINRSLVVQEKKITKKTQSNLKDFFKKAAQILSNRVFLCIVLCTAFETLLIKGFSSYLTKYLEYEYRLAASTSTMIAGAIGFLSLVFGALSGAFLIKQFKWDVKQCCKFVVGNLCVTTFLFLGLVIHCPQEKYINAESKVYESSGCVCDSNTFYPVCHKNVFIFQTPCHAGCTKFTRPNLYSKCSVLDSYLSLNGLNETSTSLTPCQRPTPHCISNLVLVSFIGLGVLFLSSIVILPILRIILESVDEENQSFALGIRSLVTKLLGNVPGPIVFAEVVDKTCIQWTRSSTGNRTCRLFNNRMFSIGLGGLGSVIRFISALFAMLSLFYLRKKDTVEISSDGSCASECSVLGDDVVKPC